MSPLLDYENTQITKKVKNNGNTSKADLILKNELLREGQPDATSQKQYDILKRENN